MSEMHMGIEMGHISLLLKFQSLSVSRQTRNCFSNKEGMFLYENGSLTSFMERFTRIGHGVLNTHNQFILEDMVLAPAQGM